MRFSIGTEFDGISVGEFLKNNLFSRRTINRLKMAEKISVNGSPVYTNYVLHSGDILDVDLTESCNIIPLPIPIDIIYRDDYVMVLNKSAGIVVHPTAFHYEDTIGNGVAYYFKKENLAYGFHPVNRLDRDTSGVLIIALNQHIHHVLQEYGHIQKTYIAIVYGLVKNDEGAIDAPIGRKPGSIIERYVCESGQRAITHYSVIKRFNDMTALKLCLETGRTHQIRVHLSYIGHPIVGDTLYGNCDIEQPIKRQALHCFEMSFLNPYSGKREHYKSPLPEDIKKLIAINNHVKFFTFY